MSHDQKVLDGWKRKKCPLGDACSHHSIGRCVMYHSEASSRHNQERDAAMMADLREPVRISCNPQPGEESTDSTAGKENIGISREEHLASFNVLADGRIVVPG